MQLKNRIIEYEDNSADLQKQIAKLNTIYSEKIHDYEELKSKINNVEGEYSNEVDDLQKELEHYKILNKVYLISHWIII